MPIAKNVPFFRGENVVIKLYQDGKKVYVATKNWTVEQNVTEVNDGVNGENRDRLDIVTNYFSGSMEVYQNDQTLMNAMIDAQSAIDAQGLPLDQELSVQINQRDGTRAAYLLKNAVLGPWDTGAQDRATAVMLKLKFRFTDYDPVTSI